jgi:hypothetical protein
MKTPPALHTIKKLFPCACLFAVLALGDGAYSEQCVTPPGGLIDWRLPTGTQVTLKQSQRHAGNRRQFRRRRNKLADS